MIRCRYCGTECYDKQARDGHEPLCDRNPINAAEPAVAPAVTMNEPEATDMPPATQHATSGTRAGSGGKRHR